MCPGKRLAVLKNYFLGLSFLLKHSDTFFCISGHSSKCIRLIKVKSAVVRAGKKEMQALGRDIKKKKNPVSKMVKGLCYQAGSPRTFPKSAPSLGLSLTHLTGTRSFLFITFSPFEFLGKQEKKKNKKKPSPTPITTPHADGLDFPLWVKMSHD